jgi:hypothetical protein
VAEETHDIIISAEAPPSPYPALGFDMQAQHANLVLSFGPGTFLVHAVTAEQMDALCHDWRARPEQRTAGTQTPSVTP